MYRIIDANLNRALEGLRCIEEYARFILGNKELTKKIKDMRHNIFLFFEKDYSKLLSSRDTINDVGCSIKNISKEKINNPIRANIKRVEQALRVLSEYGNLEDSYRYELYTIEKKIMEKTNIKSLLLKAKNIYLITNSDGLSEDEFLDKVATCLKAGVKLVQYREKNKSAKEIIETGLKLRQLCSMYDALLIVDDRIDIAQIIDADGVHLGQDDIDINFARKILGEDKIIGISTHKPDDALLALSNGADYIGVGPVFKTPTKPDKDPVGLEYVKWVKENIDIPFYAIGSIDTTNVFDVCKAGATKIAVIRALMNSDDINKTVEDFKKALENDNH